MNRLLLFLFALTMTLGVASTIVQDANGPNDPYPGPPEPTAAQAAAHCGPPAPAAGMRYEYDLECVETSGVGTEAAEKHKAAWEATAAAINDAGNAIGDQLAVEEAHLAELNGTNTAGMTSQEKAEHYRLTDAQAGLIQGLTKALQQLDRAWYDARQRINAQYFEDMKDCCVSVQEGGGGGSTTGGQNGDATTPPPPHVKPVGVTPLPPVGG